MVAVLLSVIYSSAAAFVNHLSGLLYIISSEFALIILW